MINRTKLEHILEYARQQRHIGQHCKIPPGDMVEIVEIAMRHGSQSYHQITASMAKSVALKLGAELNNEEAEIFADGYNAAMLQSSQPVPVVINASDASKADNSPESGNQVRELTMWVKRLAHSLKYANRLSCLPDKAMEYLNQNGLISVEDALR